MPSPSSRPLTQAELDALPPGSVVEIEIPYLGRARFCRLGDGTWMDVYGSISTAPDEFGGATLIPDGSPLWGANDFQGTAGTTQVWSGTQLPVPRQPRPPATSPAAPPRVLKVGDRAPTTQEAAMLPDGSIILSFGSQVDAAPAAYIKFRNHWMDDTADESGQWFGSNDEVVARIGPDFAAPMPVNADEVIALLMHDPSILAAVRAKVPDLRELADEIERILAHRTGS